MSDRGSYTKIYFCHECVGETLHFREDSDDMWTCTGCGRWSS